MKLFEVSKDGGPESTVWAYWLFEIKWLCSIVLLRFEDGSRDAYHSHAFNSVSWVLWGQLTELSMRPGRYFPDTTRHYPDPIPVLTKRSTTHKVVSVGRSWVLSFRGPWADTWLEQTPDGKHMVLTHGRKPVPVDFNCPKMPADQLKEKIHQFGASREE